MKKPSDFGGLCFSRVLVVGANGAGKTWCARRLAAVQSLLFINKDALALTTGWAQRPRVQVQAQIDTAICGEAWVLEGGPSILSSAVLQRAHLIIWLDLPAHLRFRRIVWRSVRYFGQTRPEHPIGNRDWPGPRQFRFAWRALTRGADFQSEIEKALTDSTIPVLRLKTQHEVNAYLDAVQTACESAECL